MPYWKYDLALQVWNEFKCETLLDYHKLYLQIDVLLLADVFESFRTTIINTHKLDPVYYVSLPGYTLDAALHYTKIKLYVFSDIEMYNMIESNIRGGMCRVSKRYSKANNKYMKNYNKNNHQNILLI